jgi:hypothetical protein
MFLVAKERRFMMIQMPSLRAPSETSLVRDADLFRKPSASATRWVHGVQLSIRSGKARA